MRRVLVLAMLALACGDDPETIIIPPPQYQPLTTRNAVLHNLELAYNQRNITKLDELLDDNLTFFLSEGDVHIGLPAQWDRATELSASTHLFSSTKEPSDPWPLCVDINLDVMFEDDLQWIEVPVSDEMWHTTTVFYDFLIEVEPDTHLIPVSGAKSQFTVRNAGTDDAPQWRLVEWRDLGLGNLAAARAAGVESTTWGGVKSLYRD